MIKKYKPKYFKNQQIYEDYWKFTLGLTDFYGQIFSDELRCIKDYIVNYGSGVLSNDNYQKILQDQILKISPKAAKKYKDKLPSIRKEINAFIKLGFIEPRLVGVHPLVDEFLKAKSTRRKRSLFSRIVTSNSKMKCSVTNFSDKRNYLSFLTDTLEEVGELTKDDLIGIMICDIGLYRKGYLTRIEIDNLINVARTHQFNKRKYNQISYLNNILSKMTEIVVIDGRIKFTEDVSKELYPPDLKKTGRPFYKQRVFKTELEDESRELFGEPRCMVDNITNRTDCLKASHIKPWSVCNKEGSKDQEFDPYNGLLLEKSIDQYFDKGQISFSDSGNILFSDKLQAHIINRFRSLKLKREFINTDRNKYLGWHRKKYGFK